MSKPMSFDDYLAKQMESPEFRAEWDALGPEFQVVQAIIEGRQKKGLSQAQLSEATGIQQATISRLESGTANPSIRTLQRLAAGLGMTLKLEFVPQARAGQ